MAHWSFDIADEIIRQRPDKEEYVCAAGISPSGSVHIGNFRDIATSLFVVRALRQRGKKAKLLFSWDDFDRLRKVPSNVQSFTEGFEKHIGKPYTFIEDPYKQTESYGRYFEVEFENTLKEMGVEPVIVYQTKMYTAGKYLEQIKHAMSKRKEIYDIIMSFKTQQPTEEEREAYYPINIYCDKSQKDNTDVLSYDEKTGEIEYFCHDCGEKHKVNINTYNLIKLAWKIDWPMRWMYEGVDFEPGGIDHAAASGSYVVSKEIAEKIFNYKAPIFQGYGWLGIKGLGAMHSSTGKNITPQKVLEVYEPDIIKWLFAKYLPEDAFDFAFDETIIRHYSEYDKLLEKHAKGETSEYEESLIGIFLDGNFEYKEKTPFGIIASVAPIVDFNPNATIVALKKAGVEFNKDSFVRLEKVKNWIESYNPERRFNLLSEFNSSYYATMSEESALIVSKLHDYVKNNNFTESEIQQYLYSIINDPNATKKEILEKQKVSFKNLYNMLFGRDDGPRLYLYLSAADKNNYLHLLDKNNFKK